MTGRPRFLRHVLGGQDAGRRTVVESGGVTGGDMASGPERRLEGGQRLHRGAWARRLVGGRQAPAQLGAAGGHRDQRRLDLAGSQRLGVLALACGAEGVAAFLGDLGVAVVQILRGRAHHQGGGVDDFLRDESRVRVDAGAHRVMSHVLHTAGDDHVVHAHADAAGGSGHGGHRSGAHPVQREAGNRVGQPGEQRDGPPDGQALVTGLGGGRDGAIVDPLRGQLGVAAQQFTDDLDDQVVGSGLGVDALLAGLAEGGTGAVDEHDVANRTGRASRRGSCGGSSGHARKLLPASSGPNSTAAPRQPGSRG